MLMAGVGVAVNVQEAIRYFRISSDLACPVGMLSLADLHRTGKHVPGDLGEAVRLYKLAAESDIDEAFFALCDLCLAGEPSVLGDLERVVEAVKHSAERGRFLGIVLYAELLEAGVGVERDRVHAEALFARAHARAFRIQQHNYAVA
jgi:TPR repeat protein